MELQVELPVPSLVDLAFSGLNGNTGSQFLVVAELQTLEWGRTGYKYRQEGFH